MNKNKPFFSVIVTGRNDNHGQKFSERWLLALHSIAEAAKKIGNNVEYIFVDYGSDLFGSWLDEEYIYLVPKNILVKFIRIKHEQLDFKNRGNPPYIDVIMNEWGDKEELGYGDIVDKKSTFNYAAIFNNALKYEAIANNIIVTCADDFFADDFFQYLLAENRTRKQMTICTRVNVPQDNHKNITYNDKIPIDQKVRKFNEFVRLKELKPRKEDILSGGYGGAVGDFQMMQKDDWFILKGYMEYLPHWGWHDVELCKRALNYGIKLVDIHKKYNRPFFYHLGHDINDQRTINLHTYFRGLENPDNWGEIKGKYKVITNEVQKP